MNHQNIVLFEYRTHRHDQLCWIFHPQKMIHWTENCKVFMEPLWKKTKISSTHKNMTVEISTIGQPKVLYFIYVYTVHKGTLFLPLANNHITMAWSNAIICNAMYVRLYVFCQSINLFVYWYTRVGQWNNINGDNVTSYHLQRNYTNLFLIRDCNNDNLWW